MSGTAVSSGLDLRTCAPPRLRGGIQPRAEDVRRCGLLGVVFAVAVCGLAACFLWASSRDLPLPGIMLWVAAAVVAGAQFARIRVRVGQDYVLIAWGEVATLTALCVLQPVWVPVAGAIGVAIAHVDRMLTVPAPQRLRVLYAISSLAVSTTAAASVAALVANTMTQRVDVRADPVRGIAALLLAGLVYFAASSLLAAAWVADAHNVGQGWRRAARSKRAMLSGNIAVGIAVAVVISADPRWLVGLVPVFAILHRAYVYQTRTAAEREIWATLDAAWDLHHPDERMVVGAALRAAISVFGPAEAEVALRRPSPGHPDEPNLWFCARNGTGPTEPVAVAESLMTRAFVATRPLVVGDEELGELRLGFDRAGSLDGATEPAFFAFADAVAAALGEAETRHRLRMMAARSAFEAVHDPLTGLMNRSMFVARGDTELRHRVPDGRACLVLLDVDGFRAVNDTLSYAAGDELLRVLAARLATATVEGELLGCLGGDEFALLLAEDPTPFPAGDAGACEDGTSREGTGSPADRGPDLGLADEEPAMLRARSIAALLASPIEVAGVTIAIAVTAGVGAGAVGRVDMAELLRRADVALRRARREGATVARYSATHGVSSRDRLALLADLRDALATTGQLSVVLQPVVSLETRAPVGAEVLVRWHHPVRGTLLPADFIDVIEHTELAGGLTRYVIDTALEIAAGWATQGLDLPVTVNLCARCTLDPRLPAMVAERLAARGVAAQRLILETTEGVMAAELERVERAVAALRAVGVQVSVGDFGTASASLQFLARCPVDEVKIDRSFVSTMVTSPETTAIVQATVDMARDLGIRVVAEAVELPEQRDALHRLGVTMAQGHLFYPPLPPTEATTVLQGLAAAAADRPIAIEPAAWPPQRLSMPAPHRVG